MDEGLETVLRQTMAGLIPEHQEVIDDNTVYCEPCDREYDYTPSVLSVHNMRTHEYHADIYDYEDRPRECRVCGEETSLKGVESENGTLLRACTECDALQ